MFSATAKSSFEYVKNAADVGAAALTISVVMEWAPAIAAVFTALYAAFRMYEAVYNHLQVRRQNKHWPYKDKEQ